MEAKVTWKDGMAFEAHLGGFNFMIDAHKEFGGQNKGPSPKGLTLISLAGCTGIDVVSILEKMRVKIDGFEIVTDAKVATDHPKKFEEIVVKYYIKGEHLPPKKLKDAVNLSFDAYCGVLATLRPAVNMTYEIYANGELIK